MPIPRIECLLLHRSARPRRIASHRVASYRIASHRRARRAATTSRRRRRVSTRVDTENTQELDAPLKTRKDRRYATRERCCAGKQDSGRGRQLAFAGLGDAVHSHGGGVNGADNNRALLSTGFLSIIRSIITIVVVPLERGRLRLYFGLLPIILTARNK